MILHPTNGFDNHPADNRHIEVVPLAAAMGAEIRGARLAALSDEAFAEVRAALYRHKMIYFRDQAIGPAEHEAFSLRFGAFAENAYGAGVEGHPNVQPVVKAAGQRLGMVFGAGWHTNSAFLAQPPAIGMLHAIKVPPFGGDTIWANSALAHACLSPTMRAMIAPLKVRMSMGRVVATAQANAASDETPIGRLAATRDLARLPDDLARKVEGSAHPLVRTHPVSGEKALFCDETYAAGIEGLTPAEAEPLLRFLIAHLTQAAFTCRLKWEPGMLAAWDNRLCVHQAFNDYDGFEREMHRTTVVGETPV